MEQYKVITSVILIFYIIIFSTVTVYAVDRIDDSFTKRLIQRRSLLESFCTRRCNLGRGGNMCKCSGFHFAGKRNPIDSVNSLNLGNSDIYRILEESKPVTPEIEDIASLENLFEDLQDSTDRLRDEITDIYDNRERQR